MNAILGPCHDGIMELRSGHYVKVVEITENTSKCLDEDYLVPTSPDVIYIYREREILWCFAKQRDVLLWPKKSHKTKVKIANLIHPT
jgi:hypothetical protein